MKNVITAIYQTESEGFQTLTELRQAPFADDYVVAEAVLLRYEEDSTVVLDYFVTGELATNDMAFGMLVGSVAGILGGPLGVLLGAGMGAAAGGMVDSIDFFDSNSLLAMVASKLLVGEVAIVALVDEEEPAFDKALAKYSPIIIRRDAAAVADEVVLALELAEELKNEERGQLRAEKKAELKARYDARKDDFQDRHDEQLNIIDARFNEIAARRESIVADLQANAQARKELLQARAEIVGDELDKHAKEVAEDDKHAFGL